MKAIYIYSLFCFFALCIEKASAQIVVPIQKVETNRDMVILDQHLREYAVFTMDKRELIDSLYTNGGCLFRIRIEENLDWII